MLQGSRGEVLLWVTVVHIGLASAADSGNSPAAAVGRWADCGEQAAPCRRQVPCQSPPSTFPQPCREKVEKVCRQNRSHRHRPDRRNSGNGCPPSCWGVYPRGRDSTSCRSGLRRSRTAPPPAGSRWRFLRPKRQRCYPSVPMGGVQAKGRSPVKGVGEVGVIHTSIRQSVVHLTSCCGTAWLRSSLRKKASTFCCAVRSSRSSICAFL